MSTAELSMKRANASMDKSSSDSSSRERSRWRMSCSSQFFMPTSVIIVSSLLLLLAGSTTTSRTIIPAVSASTTVQSPHSSRLYNSLNSIQKLPGGETEESSPSDRRRQLQQGFFERQKAKTLGKSGKRGKASSSSSDDNDECVSSGKSGKKSSSKKKSSSSSSSSSSKKRSGKKQCPENDGSEEPTAAPVTEIPSTSPTVAPTIPLCSVDSQDPETCLVNGQKCEQSLECCSCCCNTNGGVCASADSGATCLNDGVPTTLQGLTSSTQTLVDVLPFDNFLTPPAKPSSSQEPIWYEMEDPPSETAPYQVPTESENESQVHEQGVIHTTISDLETPSKIEETVTEAPSTVGLGSDAPSLLPSQYIGLGSDAPSLLPSQQEVVDESPKQSERRRKLSNKVFGQSMIPAMTSGSDNSASQNDSGVQTFTITADLDDYSIFLQHQSQNDIVEESNSSTENVQEAPPPEQEQFEPEPESETFQKAVTRFNLQFSFSIFSNPTESDKFQLEEETNVFLGKFLHEEQKTSNFQPPRLQNENVDSSILLLENSTDIVANIDKLEAVLTSTASEGGILNVLFVTTGYFSIGDDTSLTVAVLDEFVASAFHGMGIEEFQGRLVSTLPPSNVFAKTTSLIFSSRVQDSNSEVIIDHVNMTTFSIDYKLPVGHKAPLEIDVFELTDLTGAYLRGFMVGQLFGPSINIDSVEMYTKYTGYFLLARETIRVNFHSIVEIRNPPSDFEAPALQQLDIARSRAFSSANAPAYIHMIQTLPPSNPFRHVIDINGQLLLLGDDDFNELDTGGLLVDRNEGSGMSSAAVAGVVLLAALLLVGIFGVCLCRRGIFLEEQWDEYEAEDISQSSRKLPNPDTLKQVDASATHASSNMSDLTRGSSRYYMSDDGSSTDIETVGAVAPYDMELCGDEMHGSGRKRNHTTKMDRRKEQIVAAGLAVASFFKRRRLDDADEGSCSSINCVQ